MDKFQIQLQTVFDEFQKMVSEEDGEWTVKGFIDVYKNIYTVSLDTKVVSKIIELMIFPILADFARNNNYEMILCSYQNHYPDISFIDKETKEMIALDLKSTYRINSLTVNGMTLGAFTGYFRNRQSNKNITFPYSQYSKHYVLGIIYSKTDLILAESKLKKLGIELNNTQRKTLATYFSVNSDEKMDDVIGCLGKLNSEVETEARLAISSSFIDEKIKHSIDNLQEITSVVRDFTFFVQEKWKIAIDRPGSGNTKNIGSTNSIEELCKGTAIFTRYEKGEQFFNDFWMYYLTNDMARTVELKTPPYHNLKSYFEYKNIQL
jgi:hypothetical protein